MATAETATTPREGTRRPLPASTPTENSTHAMFAKAAIYAFSAKETLPLIRNKIDRFKLD